MDRRSLFSNRSSKLATRIDKAQFIAQTCSKALVHDQSRDECNCLSLPDCIIQAGFLKALQLKCATQGTMTSITGAGLTKEKPAPTLKSGRVYISKTF